MPPSHRRRHANRTANAAKPLLIVLTGHAPAEIRARHGDFDHWFRIAMGLPRQFVRVVDAGAGARLPAPASLAGAVISGAAAMVTERAAWSEATAGWIRAAMDAALPLFGVCYGHQLMAHALGGRVDYLPVREIGTRDVHRTGNHDGDVLPAIFAAHTTHRQSVVELPAAATAIARSELDPHQCLRYGNHAWSTQFHPEFSVAVMRAYLRLRAPQLRQEGFDVPALLATTAPTPQSRGLLRRFARHALAGENPVPFTQAANYP